MSKKVINIGTLANDKTGDSLRAAATKINDNFQEIYSQLGDGSSISLHIVAKSGSYDDLVNKPTLFSGSYNDLTNKPTYAVVATSGSYTDLTNKPTLFSGSYTDLTNTPNIPVVPTTLSSFTNDAGFITTNGIPSQTNNAGKYLTTDGTDLSWSSADIKATSTPAEFSGDPIALDLSKSIHKLAAATYSLADGVEGQVIYLVLQDNVNDVANVNVQVANVRSGTNRLTNSSLAPFRQTINSVDFTDSSLCTLIFTDGAWQQNGGFWS